MAREANVATDWYSNHHWFTDHYRSHECNKCVITIKLFNFEVANTHYTVHICGRCKNKVV